MGELERSRGGQGDGRVEVGTKLCCSWRPGNFRLEITDLSKRTKRKKIPHDYILIRSFSS